MDENFSATLPVLSIFWIFSPCNRCEVVSHHFLICSTVTNGVENHFTSLCAICMPSFMRCLCRSFFFFSFHNKDFISCFENQYTDFMDNLTAILSAHNNNKKKSHVIFNSFLNRFLVTFQLKICRQEFHKKISNKNIFKD